MVGKSEKNKLRRDYYFKIKIVLLNFNFFWKIGKLLYVFLKNRIILGKNLGYFAGKKFISPMKSRREKARFSGEVGKKKGGASDDRVDLGFVRREKVLKKRIRER